MKTLKLNNQEITNKLGNVIVEDYDKAIELGQEYGWSESDIIERKEKLSIELDGDIKDVELYCIYIDSGSDDYIYFIQY